MPSNLDTDWLYSSGNDLHLAAVAQDRGYADTRLGDLSADPGSGRPDPQGHPVTDEQGQRIYRYERLSTPWIKRYIAFNAEQAD